MNRPRHMCDGELPYDGYGAAVEFCDEDAEGRLWVGNGEHASQVNHCPYCGFRAWSPVKLERRSA